MAITITCSTNYKIQYIERLQRAEVQRRLECQNLECWIDTGLRRRDGKKHKMNKMGNRSLLNLGNQRDTYIKTSEGLTRDTQHRVLINQRNQPS